jgi:hypothetical protein
MIPSEKVTAALRSLVVLCLRGLALLARRRPRPVPRLPRPRPVRLPRLRPVTHPVLPRPGPTPLRT